MVCLNSEKYYSHTYNTLCYLYFFHFDLLTFFFNVFFDCKVSIQLLQIYRLWIKLKEREPT
jgi:hypothetical protein